MTSRSLRQPASCTAQWTWDATELHSMHSTYDSGSNTIDSYKCVLQELTVICMATSNEVMVTSFYNLDKRAKTLSALWLDQLQL